MPPGLTLVPGAELSCYCYVGGRRLGMHMLAYLFDPNHAGLSAAMAEVRDGLAARAQAMVDLLRAAGEDITWEEVRELVLGDTVGRPHIAQALVNRGRIHSVAEAFQPAWLGETYYVPKPESMEVFDALRLIRDAGGVAVLAHPRRKGRIVPREILARLAEEELFGVEADHPEHDAAARKEVRALAAEFGLVVTGSSDFHGTRKPSQIGDNTTDSAVYEQIVEAATAAVPITAGTVRHRG